MEAVEEVAEEELQVQRITVYRTWMVDYQYALPDNLPSNWTEMRAVEQDSWLRKHGFLLDTKFKEYLGVDDGSPLECDSEVNCKC